MLTDATETTNDNENNCETEARQKTQSREESRLEEQSATKLIRLGRDRCHNFSCLGAEDQMYYKNTPELDLQPTTT